MFHLELRQFPHVARAFNLERAELDARFLRPWVGGELIDFEDRSWSPERTKLKVLEGPAVPPEEMGMGRGWGAVTKHSRDVTEAVVAEARRGAQARPEVEALKQALADAAEERAIGFPDVAALAAARHPGWRASEQLAVAEQAVWELLYQGGLRMFSGGEPVARECWQEIVLRWETWAEGGALVLQAVSADDVRMNLQRDSKTE